MGIMPEARAGIAAQSAQGTIRPVEKQDNAAMAQVIRAVLTEFGCIGPGFAIGDPEVDALYETYSLPRSAYYVIEHEGVIAGGGGLAPLKGGDKDTCELQKWYILPPYRGYGYGRILFEKMVAAAKTFHYKRCYVETLGHMDTAARFYRQAGFTVLDGPMGATGHFSCNRWYVKEL